MNITVYGIAKNEQHFAKRFAQSVSDADRVVICDTGSTDKTIPILRKHGVEVHGIQVNPFRFDLARNLALQHVQDADVVVSMDIDEVALPGWREQIANAWKSGTTMVRYPFVHNWEDKKQTVPRLSVWGFKVHCPKTYVWKYPMHETLELANHSLTDNVVTINNELFRHYPDNDKQERWSRIALLQYATKDDPQDQRMAHLYGRELFFHHKYEEAITELKRHLSITTPYLDPQGDVEGIGQTRATTCRLIAQSLMALNGSPDEILIWLLRSVSESPSQREPWMHLADAWYRVGDYTAALAAIERGLLLVNKYASTEIEEWCWDDRVHQLHNKIKPLVAS